MKYAMRILILVCVSLPLSLFSQNITGSWKMTVPTEDGGSVQFKATINADGTYSLDFGADGQVEVTGKYSVKDGVMTFHDVSGSDCTAKGVYKVSVSGDTLTMTRVSDGCENRGGPEGVMKMTRA